MTPQIDQIFLKEALKIRFRWLKLKDKTDDTELELKEIKDEMELIFKQYRDKFETYEPSKTPSPMLINEVTELYNILQAKSEALDLKIKPYRDAMDTINIESDRLWDTIKQKYSDLPIEEIQKQVWTYINLNLNNNNIKI